MTAKISGNSISYMIIIIFVFFFVGGAFADNNNSVKIAKDTEGEYGQIKERYKHQNGPPSHAPAHGYRAKYQYFYLKGENWEVGISLPSHLKNDLGEYVSLGLDTDKPYLFNEEHIKKYSSKQSNSKKRKINFFTKLWILMFAR